MPFSDNHKRHLLGSFEYVDRLLTDAYEKLGAADTAQLFPPCVADASPTQRQTVADYLVRFRHIARRFLDAHEIRDERPRISALWSFRTALDYAMIGLEETVPKRLTGYGALDKAAAREVELALAELQAILRQLSEYLERGLGGDIAARLARLDQTCDEVALLRELERIVAAHGLVEFRATLDWLVGKLERGWLEVAFFGRVSCGKSSLLNALLERPVLPVGVTPVTAVPTRVVPSDAPGATIHFALEKSQRVDLDRLGEFAAEDGNPGNAKHVTDIVVELPSRLLAEGVCFVDTPGLGSLATAGAAQTLTYLPRCDLGVLLIDAAGTLGGDDVAAARKLLEAGAELVPALSKADLLGPAERERLVTYIRRELAAALALNVPVSAVSALADNGREARTWFDAHLAPRLNERRTLFAASLRRKIGALREDVVETLRRRMGKISGPSPYLTATEADLAEGRAALVRARAHIRELAWQLPRDHLAAFLASAADDLARAWGDQSSSRNPPEEILGLALARYADELGAEFEGVLAETREALVRRLDDGADMLPGVGGRPLFDPVPLLAVVPIGRGLWGRFGDAARHAEARRRLETSLAEPLAHALRAYANALERWALRELEMLEEGFDAACASVSIQSRMSPAPNAAGISPTLAEDVERLQRWNEEKATTGENELA